MTIKKGEKTALAGINGAGKSTLVKLIMRLYDPTEGSILINGIDIRQFNIKQYREHFSTIFQDYQMFAVTLTENIFMREVTADDKEQAVEYLHQSRLMEFDNQLETTVTKEFDRNGLVFSGGQSQKVAIARAFAKDGDFVVMDEASSALDPISEAEVYDVILSKLRRKSFIVISHRLSAIQNMDKIYFLQDGRIAESGSHKELLALNGHYARMYNVQAEKYQKKEQGAR